MSIKYYNHDEGIEKLSHLLLDEKLTPIFGSGFTFGCQSSCATVPDGKEAADLMKALIHNSKASINLDGFDFNKISDRFYKIVDKETRKNFFKNYFTEVTIKKENEDFLNLPWPYVFTINIDDGIENTGLYKPVLPYSDADVPNQSKGLVYKLHGDAYHEIISNDEHENIIFSSQQYIMSLTSPKNTTIINAIKGDFKQNNIVFIGCSLKNEPDLQYIYNDVKDELPPNGLRAILKTHALSETEEMDIEDYGINTVILVENYRSFYIDFVNAFNRLKAAEDTKKYPFTNPKICDVSDDSKLSIKYFATESIFDHTNNIFYKSGMHISRAKLDTIIEHLNKHDALIIQGRRFSGKTHILCSLAESFAEYETIFFPSDTVYDEDVVKAMFKEKKNTLFLFDSNSLSEYAYREVVYSIDKLKLNKNKLVIAINSKDLYLSESLNAEIIHISPKFYDEKELKSINKAADRYSLIRRNRNNTNIDYLKRLVDEQRIDIDLSLEIPNGFSKNERAILFLLCLKDKLYYSDISSIGISFREVDILLKSMKGIIEKIPVSKGENSHHSTEKLIHNSKYVLLGIMNSFTSEEIIETITFIVSKTINDYAQKRLYVETVLFDTLNQFFGKKSGAGRIIYAIYDELQKYLYNNMDYWLQRSKSIYRINPENEEELLNAYSYAKKANTDGDDRIKAKSSLTLSLICCLLSEIVSNITVKNKYELESIDYAYKAVSSDYFKKIGPIRLNSEFERNNKRGTPYYDRILKICDNYYNKSDSNTLYKIITIKNVLSEVEKEVSNV